MCGIGGFFAKTEVAADTLLRGMQSALRHRGPDGKGRWQDPRGTAGLVHARLAVIDLSDAAAQPMRTRDGRFVIAFNGEIYNFRELRKELEARGETFTTQSDTEVLLTLLRLDGVAALRKLRGMYALALWDARQQRGMLARDGFGIKPLYYAWTPQGMVFASELRALLASAAVPFRIDPAALADFFATGSVPEPASLVEGVQVLPAGHALLWDAKHSRLEEFWSVRFPRPEVHDADQAVRVTRAALEGSIAAHFVSDVPVGLFLSGGIDSTALLALAGSTGYAEQMATFSISVDDPRFDEAAAAAATARHFGSRHQVLRLDAAVANSTLPEFLDSMDVPSIDGFNTWTVSRLASAHGMKVVLSGLGGDELFGGYPSFRLLPRLHALLRLSRAAPWLANAAGRVLAQHARSSRGRRLGGLLQGPTGLAEVHRAYRGVFPPAEVRKLVAYFTGGNVQQVTEPVAEVWPGDIADRISYLELTRYMRNQLLRDSDVMSMAHGLELRLPLVDQRLFETVATIAPDLRLRAGKRLLTDAVPEIPDAVRSAPKRGFSFPFQAWFRQSLDARLGKDHRLPVRASEWYQQWAIMVFSHWLEARQREARH